MPVEDVIIVGSGPAAHSAALYTSSKSPLLFEGTIIGGIGPGGQLTTTTAVDNYPGFPHGTDGPLLMESMRNHSINNNVRIITKSVINIDIDQSINIFNVYIKNASYQSRSLIIATGASANKLNVPGSDTFWQKGISACAVCDGAIFRNKIVAVIGGGDTAMEEALYLSNIASKVILIHRRNEFRCRNDKLNKIKEKKNIEIITPAELISAHGDDKLKRIKIINKEKNKEIEIEVDGLFYAIGHTPNVGLLGGLVNRHENGYLIADARGRTSVEGIFACGDVCDYKYRQAVTAAASGCIAGIECMKYLEQQKNE